VSALRPSPIKVGHILYVRPEDVCPDDERSAEISKRAAEHFAWCEAALALDDEGFVRSCRERMGETPTAENVAGSRAWLREQLDKYGPTAERTAAVDRTMLTMPAGRGRK
jgi:hypothetical protein